jgi:PAS domain S-box-containing protein
MTTSGPEDFTNLHPSEESPPSSHALPQGEKFYRRLTEYSPVATVLCYKGRIVYVNPAAINLIGAQQVSDLLGKLVTDFAPPEKAEQCKASLKWIEQSGTPQSFPMQRLTRLDGREIVANVTFTPAAYRGRPAIQIMAVDITDYARTMQALQESEARYRQIFDGITDICYIIDNEWHYTHANQAASRATRLMEEELLGRDLHSLHPAIEETTQFKAYRQVMETGQPRRFTTEGPLLPGGLPGTYEVRVYPIPDGILCIASDISDLRRTEEALRESEARYRALADSITDVFFALDRDLRYTYWNKASEAITGIPAREAIGKTLFEVFHGEKDKQAALLYREVMESQQPRVLVAPFRFKEREYYLEVNIYPSQDGVAIIARDITEQVRAQQIEREQYMLIEALHDAALATNSTLELDEVFERILDNVGRVVPHDAAVILLIKGEEAVSIRTREHIEEAKGGAEAPIRLPVAATPNLYEMYRTGRPLVIEDVRAYPGWKRADSYWISSFAGAPIQLDNEVIGFLNLYSARKGAFNETHAQRLQAFADQAAIAIRNAQLYEAARQHADELEKSNQELDAFSYTVAHDLRAPLQVIVGYANLLRTEYENTPPEVAAEYLQSIEVFAQKMDAMIQSLLLLAKLHQASEIPTAEVDMNRVARDALKRFREVIEAQHITVEVAPGLPPALGHTSWLEEVFANLIDNAIKYIGEDNPTPRIAIRGKREGEVSRYEVEDNGIGIAREEQNRLFEEFTRLHKGETIKGFGLGLSIVLRIVTRLNGQVGVKSEPGQGSTFWFTLPAPPEEQSAPCRSD